MVQKPKTGRRSIQRLVLGMFSVATVNVAQASALEADTHVISAWNNGASLSVILKNTGNEPIDQWEASWTWPGEETITYTWDAQIIQEGVRVTAKPSDKNLTIPPGEAIAFGFNLEGPNPNVSPVISVTYAGDTDTIEPSPDPTPGEGDRSPSDPTPEPPTVPETPSTDGWAVPTNASVEYTVANDWGSGFMANVVVRNSGTKPLEDWRVRWIWPDTQSITYIWNADFVVEQNSVTVNANGQTIPPGQAIAFGFNASGSGTPAPTPVLEVPGINTVEPTPPAPQQPPATVKDVDSVNQILGTQTVAPHYQFTNESKLVETAEAIQSMGSNILKIALSPQAYGITDANHLEYQYTQLLSEEPSFVQVLNMDFAHYFFWVETAGEIVDGDGLNALEAQREYQRLYDLTTYLLETFDGTGKTFYLGHWEGDWRLLNDVDRQWDRSRQDVPEDRIQGMIDWLNIRQQAVDDAKTNANVSNVDVFHYVELNLVESAQPGWDRIVNRVLPYVNVDLVSYSCYDSTTKIDNEAELRQRLVTALDTIEANLPAKPGLPFERRVFIGEFGFPLYNLWQYNDAGVEQNRRAGWLIETAMDWGTPFILYWQMYDNEYDASLNSYSGFWLIDRYGDQAPLYDTYQGYYQALDTWISEFKTTFGRAPSQAEIDDSAAEIFRESSGSE
ncbi:MAG: cellulose binding domain-containing protein [Verrucomicrobiota bacterium]